MFKIQSFVCENVISTLFPSLLPFLLHFLDVTLPWRAQQDNRNDVNFLITQFLLVISTFFLFPANKKGMNSRAGADENKNGNNNLFIIGLLLDE